MLCFRKQNIRQTKEEAVEEQKAEIAYNRSIYLRNWDPQFVAELDAKLDEASEKPAPGPSKPPPSPTDAKRRLDFNL